ncbi:MAG: hypothetical protein A2W03_16390 [Candidatus Aminicenantes bacterium RBG_16_63_16]|nr:MAG: hypothetical protein A2W03_16390 [Candidatus Aminicenantes bacterium RBG_16_63_16]
MNSPEKSWRISRVANEARRAIEALDLKTQEKILRALESLQKDPFPKNVKKIKGKEDIFRLRVGNFRIYFRIASSSRCVEIVLFDQRGAIKNKILERF